MPHDPNVREVKLGGQTIRIRPLSVDDLSGLMCWVQDRVIEIARRASEGLPSAERIELLQGAINTASRLTLDSPDTLRVLGSIDGATRMLWLCVRNEHPELDQAKLIALIVDPQTMTDTLASMQAVNEAAKETARKTVEV